MERRGRGEGLLERAALALDLPADAAGAPRVELTGRHELRMENHRGILAYGREEIVVSGGRILFRVRGTDLELKAMTGMALLITGTIRGLELE